MCRMKDKKDGEEEGGKGEQREEEEGRKRSKGEEEGEDDGEGGGAASCGPALAGYHVYTLFPSIAAGWCCLFHFTERRVRAERLSDMANVRNLRHRAWIGSHVWLTWPSPVAQW